MRQAVSVWGTATSAAVDGVSVAGKTGTAEFGPDLGGGHYESHAWFAGFAPAEDPQIAVVVFLEQGKRREGRRAGGRPHPRLLFQPLRADVRTLTCGNSTSSSS